MGRRFLRRKRGLAAPCLCLCLLPAAPVAIAASDEAREATTIEKVTVTARRRDERVLDVPIAVTVLPGDELSARGASRLQRILPQVPNVSFEAVTPRLMNVAIRGLGRNLGNDGLEASAGVFLDGVYLGRLGMAATDLSDLKQVEVLRGPQGTLFGKNTTAGVVSIVTREPQFEREIQMELTGGNRDHRELRSVLGGALVDGQLAYRLNGFETRRDGFVSSPAAEHGLGELDRRGVRGQLLWLPLEGVRVRLIADYGVQSEDGPGLILVDPVTQFEDGATRPNNFLVRAARAGYTPLLDPLQRQSDADRGLRGRTKHEGISAQADWRFAGLDATSITAWRRWQLQPATDGDLTALDIQPELGFEVRDWQLSEELRLASPGTGRVQYVGGIFLFAQRLDSTFNSLFGEDAADWFRAGLPAYVLDGFRVTTLADPATDSGAVFGQATWRMGERIEATAGARWTRERKSARIVRTSSGGEPLAPTDAAALAVRTQLGSPSVADVESTEGFLSGLLTLSYHLGAEARAYFSVARGAKSGGINTAVVPEGIDQVLDPEVATSMELGFKFRSRDGHLELATAAFHADVKDYQAAIRDAVRGTIFLGNAASVRSWGFELEGAYRPNAHAFMALALGWNDARFRSFPSSSCPAEVPAQPTCDLSGRRVPGSQPWKAILRAGYSQPVASGRYEAFGGFDLSATDGYQGDLSQRTLIPAANLLDVRLGVRRTTGLWEAWLWSRNALDENYYATKTSGGSFNTGAVFGIPGDPRTYGLSFRLSL